LAAYNGQLYVNIVAGCRLVGGFRLQVTRTHGDRNMLWKKIMHWWMF